MGPAGGMSLLRLLDGLARPAQDVMVADLCLDSRHCRPGSVFVALRGDQGHGLDYLEQAVAAGAVAVIYDDAQTPSRSPVPTTRVCDLGDHLPLLAARFFGSVESMDLVAVTGTNGKTSVAWLLAQALDAAMLGTLGVGRPGQTRAATHTTPDILSLYRELAALRAEGCSCVVLEASSHALDQQRLAGLSFSSVIFTGLGHDHLDYHANLEAYFEAKSRLFTDYKSHRQIINLDDPHGRVLSERIAASDSVLSYSLKGRPEATVRLAARRADLAGLEASLETSLETSEGEELLSCPLIGRVNLHNLAIVALELRARGLSATDIQARVAALQPVPGRMQVVIGGNGIAAIVDYAHTPDALEFALTSLSELSTGQLWCVFGCGGDRDKAKRPLMGRIAESLSDQVILTDDNPRSEDGTAIVREIQGGMRRPERSRVIRNRVQAIRTALHEAKPGDLVLIAGKGHETTQWVGAQAHSHSDVAVVRDSLEAAA